MTPTAKLTADLLMPASFSQQRNDQTRSTRGRGVSFSYRIVNRSSPVHEGAKVSLFPEGRIPIPGDEPFTAFAATYETASQDPHRTP
jgi:hypothetical protein